LNEGLESVQGTFLDNFEFKNLTAVIIVAVTDWEAAYVVIHLFKQQKICRLNV